MKLVENFFDLVNNAFAPLQSAYNLSICSVTDCEVVVAGGNFMLLIWLDFDGVSIKYCENSKSGDLAITDVGYYLIVKRKWVVDDSLQHSSDFTHMVKHSLLAFVRNLESQASDILRGEKQWLKDVVGRQTYLDKSHAESILAAIYRSGKRL